jgi:hypothetical protein
MPEPRWPERFPKEGFLKVVSPEKPEIDSVRKAALVRKGNQCFNDGDISTAEKIFVTIGYTDGIIRVGDYYYKRGEVLEAFRLFRIAPAPERVSEMIESMAAVVRNWLEEE